MDVGETVTKVRGQANLGKRLARRSRIVQLRDGNLHGGNLGKARRIPAVVDGRYED